MGPKANCFSMARRPILTRAKQGRRPDCGSLTHCSLQMGVCVMLKCIRCAVVVPLLTVAAACSTGESSMSGSQATMAAPVAEDAVLKRDSLAALQTLYAAEPKAKEIGMRSKAILVFPNLVKAGFIAGVQGGDGVLIENGKITGVYNNTAVSYGLQAGVQTFAEAMFLTT